jgi:2-polyprenyl-3-methyl-5-hydroxy-6-metoxy-1,4-benzoquinol methylase
MMAMVDLADKRQAFPELMRIVDTVAAQNPLQRKRIEGFIATQDEGYWSFAEDLSHTINHAFLHSERERTEAARSYNRMCMDILREQIRFRKTGTYLLEDADVARETVYAQTEIMRYYITGLLLSYLFWPNHYSMIHFFKEHLEHVQVRRCLEVGAGHGLFTAEVIRRFPNLEMTLVDISETSINLSREILTAFQLDPQRVQFIQNDFLAVSPPAGGFDFIVMGEVLEHVNDAMGFLAQARRGLAADGAIFLSTCVNCPAIDHIYHFHTVDEIRDLVRSAGLTVVRDLAMPAENVPADRWQEELVTINYCAILAHDHLLTKDFSQ